MALVKTKEGIVTKNSQAEQFFRNTKEKDGQKHLDNFLELFDATGLSDDRKGNLEKVPIAKKIAETGTSVGNLINSFEGPVIAKLEESGKNLIDSSTPSQNRTLPNSVLISLSTAVILVESIIIMVFSVFRGVCEAIMRGGCALADLLFIHLRGYFQDVNPFQEIMMALIYFVGCVYANVRCLLTHILKSAKQLLILFLEVKFDKTISSAADNVLSILFNVIEFYVLLYFFQFKILIMTTIVLVIISFFLKMDDVIKERSFFAGVKTRAFSSDGGGGGEDAFDFFAYVDQNSSSSVIDDVKEKLADKLN